jgi:DNA-binding transcriptional ArsR family regulator
VTGGEPNLDQVLPNYIQNFEWKAHAMDSFQESAELFKVLAHPERLRLLAALRDGEECVCHLTALLKQRQPYVSQQLGYLRDAGLIRDRKEGLRVYYRVTNPMVFQVLDDLGMLIGRKNAFISSSKQSARVADCDCPHCAPPLGTEEGKR